MRGTGVKEQKNLLREKYRDIRRSLSPDEKLETDAQIRQRLMKLYQYKNARVVIISFHSLEDKIVTSTMRSWQKGDDDMDAYLLGAKVNLGIGKLITKKALVPSEKEILENHASRSSLMRVFEFN